MKHLVLLGGGHAHVEVLRQLAQKPFRDTAVTLVSSGRHTAYTGMVPGFLAGRYSEAEVRFDLAASARAAGATFLDATVASVDGVAQVVHVGDRAIPFDACSIDVGSSPAGQRVPGVTTHAIPLRPLGNALTVRQRFDALRELPKARCVVVGGGAGGIEVALALAERGHGVVPITLVHTERELLPTYPRRARQLAAAACAHAGVTVLADRSVVEVAPDHVMLSDHERVPSALTVWLAGAAPPALLAASRLPRTAGGYFEVDASLRATDGRPVWGAGDCISLRDHPWVAKAGVYAVRQGPVLAQNLRAFCEGTTRTAHFAPRRDFLSLLSVSRDRALLSYYGVALAAGWAQHLKQRIDRRFMARYQVPWLSSGSSDATIAHSSPLSR